MEELLRRRRARTNLLDFTTYTNPAFEVSWHHRLWCRYLDDMISGKIKRLLVFAPPRHGKSELVSRRLPAYILGRNPDAHIIACSYSADLASQMNRDVQRIIDDEAYGRLFPETRLYGKNVRTMARGTYMRNSDLFEVVGRKGRYRSAGIGGGIMGMGFHFGIIDDPIKSIAEALSPTIRQNVADWYSGTFYNRQMKDARILVTLTRWHMDDLAGRLLKAMEEDKKADKWTILRFPALAEPEDERHPEDPRQEGDPLWPSWYGREFLDTQRAQGAHTWAALYQQRPQLREGGMFKRAWFTKLVDAVPVDARRVRYWDRAATENGGCFTCGVLMAMTPDGLYYVEHVVRGQWSPRERDLVMLQTSQADAMKYPKVPPAVWFEHEPGSSGVDSAQATVRFLAGFNVHAHRPSGPKEARAEPWAAQLEAGNVFIVKGDWSIIDWIEEHTVFPNGTYADQVDASSGSFGKLAQPLKRAGLWAIHASGKKPTASEKDKDKDANGKENHEDNANGTTPAGEHDAGTVPEVQAHR